MPDPNVPFAGETLIIPGAYFQDIVQPPAQPPLPTTPPLCIIGYGYGGAPQTAYNFASVNDWLNFVRGGPVANFGPFFGTPSPQLNGAQLITYINPGENTQSQAFVQFSGASGLANFVQLESTNYGTPSNQLEYEITAIGGGVLANTLTVYDGYSGSTIVSPPIGIPLYLAYVGTATGGTSFNVQTSGSGVSLESTQLNLVSPNRGESFSIALNPANYGTIEQVVEYINGTGVWTAYVYGMGAAPSSALAPTSGTALSPPSLGQPQYAPVYGNQNEMVFWFNQYASNFIVATAVSGGSTISTNIPDTNGFIQFTGAVSVPPTLGDYADAFNVALQQPAWVVFADSNASGVIALGTAHALLANEPVNGMYRRFFSGSSIGDSVASAILAAQSMAINQGMYFYPGIYRTNTQTGVTQLYGGLYVAAAAAAMACGNIIATPLTNKSLLGTGVEVTLTVSQINQLQQGGVAPIWVPTQTGLPTIISDMTTWQSDSNALNMFSQEIACRQWTAYSLVNACKPYIGTIAAPQTMVRIQNAVKNTLNALLYTEGSNGVLAAWDTTSLVLSYDGATQTLAISASVQPVGQNRFITITASVQTYSATLTSSANNAIAA